MCGIAAIVAYGQGAPPVDRDELLAAREAMVPRGPDDCGLWLSTDGRAGMAHRRLSIIDLTEAGRQPMATVDGRLRIVFNGEIYNYRVLRQQLERRGYDFRSTSDTEVLLHLYADKGPSMVHHLRGMYAFALWDETRGGMLLARDPFGIKPLYYADDGHRVRAASQVKALLATGRVDTTAEPAGHVGFFLWGYVPEPYTLYRGIRALPAGCTLWVDRQRGAGRPEAFFNIRDEIAAAGEGEASDERPAELVPRLREALEDSVRHHLVADVPVGVFLSAGLDSATLVALASEVVPGNLRTLTLGFSEYRSSERDETMLAGAVACHYGTAHETRWVTRDDFLADFDVLVDAMDQPSIDGVNTYFVSKAAARAGLKVALSGLGGDELFGGYPSFVQIPRTVATVQRLGVPEPLSTAVRKVSAPLLGRITSPKYAGVLEYGRTYGAAYLLRRALFMPWELPEVLPRETVEEGWGELRPVERLDENVAGVDDAHWRVSALETSWYMRNQLLRDADWAGMAHSLEIRVPLVDLELFRSVLRVGGRTGRHATKQDLARTPRVPLPDQVMSRKKTGFSVPVREWLASPADETRAHRRGLRGWACRLYEHWRTA